MEELIFGILRYFMNWLARKLANIYQPVSLKFPFEKLVSLL